MSLTHTYIYRTFLGELLKKSEGFKCNLYNNTYNQSDLYVTTYLVVQHYI